MSLVQSILERFVKRSHQENGEPDQYEMPFLEHLEDLRKQIIRVLVGLLLATIACAVYTDFIVQVILLHPLRASGLKAQVLSPYGIVMLYMEAALFCGFILSMPNTLYWLWRFVAPGLLRKERMYVSRIVALTSFCFFAGVAFGYFVLLPAALTFFANFGTQNLDLNISIDRYVSFVLALIVGAGLVFELPMVSYFLSKMGFLTPAFMRHYRRHAIVVILIIAAIVTPTPDIITQTLLALPMMLLYEVSIIVSKYSQKKEPEETKAEPA
jgi:sec-independent protein translocase protein TatC